MKLKTTTLLIVVISLLATSTIQAKTKKLLRFNLEKGAIYELVMNLENNIDQMMMGQQIKMEQKMKMVAKLTVEDVLANNNFLIRYNYKSIKMDTNAMNNTISFNTDSLSESNPAFDLLKGFTKIQLTLEITPKGEIVNVGGFDSFNGVFTGNPKIKEALKTFSDEKYFKTNFTNTFNYFPEEEVSIGDTWSTSKKVDVDFDLLYDAHFKVLDFQKNNVILEVDSDIDSKMDMDQNGMNINISMKGNKKGEMTIDYKDGMMRSSELEQDLTMLMKMKAPEENQDIEMPMKMVSKTTISVSKL